MVRGVSDYDGCHIQAAVALTTMGSCIIRCRPPKEKVLDFGERDQMSGVIDNSEKLLAAYDLLFSTLNVSCPCGSIIEYDFTRDESEYLKIRKYCTAKINHYDERKRRILQAEQSQKTLIKHLTGV